MISQTAAIIAAAILCSKNNENRAVLRTLLILYEMRQPSMPLARGQTASMAKKDFMLYPIGIQNFEDL